MSTRAAALLVEDNEEFAQDLRAALTDRGLGIDWAQSWEDGLGLFRVNAYELVVADYNLPDTELGLKLLAQMKVLSPTSKLILISGALTPGAERALAEVPLIDAYYSKADGNLIRQIAEHVEHA